MNSLATDDEAIFHAARGIDDPDRRREYILSACKEEPALVAHVEALLAACEVHDRLLDRPAIGGSPITEERPGSIIGPYKLVEQIGEGGMGLVFLAEQSKPVRRLVALKVLKPGLDTRHVLARFEAERQALALMDHPHIAKILDAGTIGEPEAQARESTKTLACASGSRPYFVMELVRGVPITEFCDAHRLDPRRRLALFADVCRAIQHAHTKGVIHRDLKPSNILVTLHDTVPVPKVIDFGIAKATGERLTDRTLVTQFSQVVGTPLYMSPEQAEMNGLDVDTRSDVYALGVLLYELLTGATPFDPERLRRVGYDETRRILREEEPPRPSKQVATLAAEAASTVSERRGVDARKYAGLLRGDLDWIVMKALEKDRNRRYESASALAADVERYLAGDAIEARPPSAAYRVRKFARRHKVAMTAGVVVAVALMAATAVSVWQAVDATSARREAAAEAAIAKAVNEFLQADLIRQVSSAPPPDREFDVEPYLTVKEALDRASARIGERFKDQPLVEAAIRKTIGETYFSLSANQVAVSHLERAVDLRTTYLGPDHADTLASVQSLAHAYSRAGRHSEAIARHRRVYDNHLAQLGTDHPETLTSIGNLAGAYQLAGHWETSRELLEELLKHERAVCGPSHPLTIGTMHSLALNYENLDRLTESMSLYEKVLNLKSAVEPADNIFLMLCYAFACQRAEKFDQAERLLREALEHCDKRDNSVQRTIQAATLRGWLAGTLLLQGQYLAAEPLIQDAVAVFEKERPDNPRLFYWINLLGAVLAGQQRYAEAEPHLLRGFEGMKEREAILPDGEKRRMAECGERIVRFYEATGRAKLVADRH